MEQTHVWPGLSREEFLQRLTECKLLSQEELLRAASLSHSAPAVDFAQALVDGGLLTSFQADAIRRRQLEALQIGNYDVLDKLGAGGMGTVFKARHRRMKRIVALKVLAKEFCTDANFVQRFQREVETIARLSHPNIVMAYDADESDAGHFLVMEFVQGQDLQGVVQKQGPRPLRWAVNCILQAAQGLAYAHGKGIIHRDIKPANLLCDEKGVVKVTDLGLARFSSTATLAPSAESAITKAGGVLGTADYMSPEQAVDSTTIDHRADIYSLGCTLYFLLVGKPPYQGTTLMGTLLKHRDAPIPSMMVSRGDVPPSLDAIFARMVAKAPADRYQQMNEVVQALQEELAHLGDAGPVVSDKTICFPSAGAAGVATESRQGLEATVLGAPAATSQKPVLLVEPSRTQAAIIRKYLQADGLQEIVTVTTGKEALETAQANPPSAVLSAMHLSDMTGIQLAKQLQGQLKPRAPGFVLISTEAESREAGEIGGLRQVIVLHKPFTPEQLGRALAVVRRQSVAAGAAAKRPGDRSGKRVLIADDSAVARVQIRRVLSDLGFTQFTDVADGAQAVAAVTRESFDLVVSDYNMPYMDGHGLVGFLKQNPSTAAVPIIMCTTEADPAKLEALHRLGVAGVCDKSFDSEHIREIVDRLM